jgi:hypothetical protein
MAIKVGFENEHHRGRGKRASRVLAELDGLEERLNKVAGNHKKGRWNLYVVMNWD